MYTDFQRNILMNNEAIEKFYKLFEQPSYNYKMFSNVIFYNGF